MHVLGRFQEGQNVDVQSILELSGCDLAPHAGVLSTTPPPGMLCRQSFIAHSRTPATVSPPFSDCCVGHRLLSIPIDSIGFPDFQ